MGLTVFLCRKKRENLESTQEETTIIIQPRDEEGVDVPRKFSYDELMVATNNFSKQGLLGEGGFGKVYLGLLRGETNVNVAVKRITQGSQQGMKEYLSEVRTISRLRHKNLVQLLGWCRQQPHDLLLIYEFMSNNSLDFHLFNNQPHTLTWPRRYTIAMDLASALFYLQEWCDPCILHRDIKLSNVLLTLNFRAKLGDFGLARPVEDGKLFSQTTDVLFGTEGYIAPEYADSKRASKESDIYSLGVLLVQLACGKGSIGQVNGNKVKLVEWLMDVYKRGNILEAADSRLQGNYEKDQMERLMVVGLACAQLDYFDRPTIREVVDMLNFKAPLPSQLKMAARSIFINEGPNYNLLDSGDSNKTRTHSSGGSSSSDPNASRDSNKLASFEEFGE